MPQKPLWGGGCECPLPPRRNTLHGKAQLRWFQLPVALWPKSLQGPSIDQRKVNHMMHWWQRYLSERLHPACTDMKGAPADKTKSVNVTPKMWLVSPVKLIQWFLPSHFCEVPQKKKTFSHSVHCIPIRLRNTWSVDSKSGENMRRVRWPGAHDPSAPRRERCKHRFPLWFQSNLCF